MAMLLAIASFVKATLGPLSLLTTAFGEESSMFGWLSAVMPCHVIRRTVQGQVKVSGIMIGILDVKLYFTTSLQSMTDHHSCDKSKCSVVQSSKHKQQHHDANL